MNTHDLFLARYEKFESIYLARIWKNLTHEQMRQQPHQQVNTVVWNLWHIVRVEDIGIKCFIAEQAQELDAGNWNEKLGLKVRNQGTGMSQEEMLNLSNQIDIDALKAYRETVHQHTLKIAASLSPTMLDETLDDALLKAVLADEGAAHPNAGILFQAYKDWTKGMCLMHFAVTHNYQHLGEIVTISSLMGVDVLGV